MGTCLSSVPVAGGPLEGQTRALSRDALATPRPCFMFSVQRDSAWNHYCGCMMAGRSNKRFVVLPLFKLLGQHPALCTTCAIPSRALHVDTAAFHGTHPPRHSVRAPHRAAKLRQGWRTGETSQGSLLIASRSRSQRNTGASLPTVGPVAPAVVLPLYAARNHEEPMLLVVFLLSL